MLKLARFSTRKICTVVRNMLSGISNLITFSFSSSFPHLVALTKKLSSEQNFCVLGTLNIPRVDDLVLKKLFCISLSTAACLLIIFQTSNISA